MDTALLQARIGLIVWLALAGAFYALSFGFDDASVAFVWGPAAWPRAVLLLMAAAAIANYAANRPGVSTAAPQSDDGAVGAGEIASTIGMVAIPLIYVWLIPRAGFYVSTLIFLPAYMMHLGERRWWRLAGVTLLLFVLVNLVFTRLFYVALPTGGWPFFYDISNWLVTFVRS